MPGEDSLFAKDEVSAAFDRMSSYYASARGQSPWFQAQLKIVLDMLDSEPGLLLDVGCAAGAEFESLLASGHQIVGLDYAPKMLGLAQQRFGASRRVHLCRADAELLPFPDASFDQLICLGVLEYLPTYDRCLDEIQRVLRPRGVAVISLPTCISLDRCSNYLCNLTAVPLWRAIKRLMGKRTSNQPVGKRWNRCIPWQLPALLRRRGLNPEKSAYSGFLLFPLGHLWPAAEFRLFSWMERFSKSHILGWTLSQYLVSARKS